ncbi:hypothetical protein [Trueperella bialowiezensis]|uniref:Uncharacterized protein n=1 Tax=Trueperella bialowiezensis TaxID=312285 RepID=A0A3S4VGW3_9ACTO|nr:hypothetical protein [Trueperella bialowiezensis]VEI13806.1 Uncharacterised protein [Trueperella bialowiezensis]
MSPEELRDLWLEDVQPVVFSRAEPSIEPVTVFLGSGTREVVDSPVIDHFTVMKRARHTLAGAYTRYTPRNT